MAERIAPIVLNYCNVQDTLSCAASLWRSHEPPWLLVLVDNASPDTSLAKMRNWLKAQGRRFSEIAADSSEAVESELTRLAMCGKAAPEALLVSAFRNRGYATGNNLGMAAALALGADAVWVLNNDTVVAPEALGNMRERLFASPRNGLCGSLVCYMGTDTVQCCAGGFTNMWTCLSRLTGQGLSLEEAHGIPRERAEARLDFIYGASVMASRLFLEEVGLMDERFFLYCEEQDWGLRASGRFALVYAPEAIVWHKEGRATGMNRNSKPLLRLIQLVRSRILLTWKHKPLALLTVVMGCTFASVRLLVKKLSSPLGISYDKRV